MDYKIKKEDLHVLEKFLRYVKINTQSDEASETFPSTKHQFDLANLLVKELKELGLEDAHVDEYCYVYATLPSNLDEEIKDKVPPIGFIAHLDTYPEVSGKDVKPILHENYDGKDIVLPGEEDQVIKVSENPKLKDFIGDTIITSDGTTLLGADDKAGIAEIMAAVEYMVKHPEFKHPTVKIAFTPDEEVGQGTKYFDVKKFGVKYAYTMDGGYPGEVENETFCADSAIVTVKGKDVHPGYAKNKLVNAVRAASYFITLFKEDSLPETTEGKEGYVHPYQINGNVSEVKITTLLRDFEIEGLKEKRKWVEDWAKKTEEKFPGVKVEVEIKEYYRNMKYKIMEDPKVLNYAIEAVKRAGLKPVTKPIRGGTDGATLCYMGVLTPNIFAGGMNFHSKQEWVALKSMKLAAEVILHILRVWTENSSK